MKQEEQIDTLLINIATEAMTVRSNMGKESLRRSVQIIMDSIAELQQILK